MLFIFFIFYFGGGGGGGCQSGVKFGVKHCVLKSYHSLLNLAFHWPY